MKLEWWVVFYLEPNRQVMHWISKQKSVSKDEESGCAGCLLLLFISRLMNNNKNILKNLSQSEGRRMCKYILFCALIRLFLKSRSACHQVFYVDVFSKHLLNLILFVSFLLATAGACFILQVPLRQLMSSTGKGSPKSCHLSSSPSSSSLQTSTTIWSSMSFLLLLLHHVKDAAADVVRTPQQHHVETFVGWYVCLSETHHWHFCWPSKCVPWIGFIWDNGMWEMYGFTWGLFWCLSTFYKAKVAHLANMFWWFLENQMCQKWCAVIYFVLLSIFRHETSIQRRKSMANGKIIPSFQSWKTKMIPTDLKSISLQEQDSFRSFSRGRRETDRPLMLMVWLMNL